jgi:hypothetical protein
LHVPHGGPFPLERLIQAFALDGERAGVVVGHTVDQQDGIPEPVGVQPGGQGAPLSSVKDWTDFHQRLLAWHTKYLRPAGGNQQPD